MLSRFHPRLLKIVYSLLEGKVQKLTGARNRMSRLANLSFCIHWDFILFFFFFFFFFFVESQGHQKIWPNLRPFGRFRNALSDQYTHIHQSIGYKAIPQQIREITFFFYYKRMIYTPKGYSMHKNHRAHQQLQKKKEKKGQHSCVGAM